MRDTRKWRVTMAGAGAIVGLLATSVFADETPRDRTRNDGRQRDSASVQAGARNDLRQSGQMDRTSRQTEVVNAQAVTRNDLQQGNRNRSYDRNGNQRNGAYNRNDNAVRQNNRARQDRTVVTQSSRNDGNWNNDTRSSRGSYRENDRVTLSGRVTSYQREGNGYRVQLDRGGNPFWIPEARLRSFGHDLRVGVSISLGGIFRGGRIEVDALNYPGNYGYGYGQAGYGQGYVQGVVDRVDYRTGVLWMRDDASGQIIDVDMRPTARASRIDMNDLRPGDYVSLSGEWVRGGLFSAYRIDSVNSGRY